MNAPSLDQDALLAAAQAGDRAALDQLLRRYRGGVYRYGLRVCPTTEDAEDAVQITLWVAARSIGAFRGASAVTTWLFSIVRRQCQRLHGRSRRRAELDRGLDAAPPAPSPEDELAADELRRLLSGALAGLDPAHRDVLLLRDVRGLPAPEAAAALGLSVPALKSRLHRARARLQQALAGAEPAGSPQTRSKSP
jgi:RNA polymerase sigma-70 factor (ECF subfamily)